MATVLGRFVKDLRDVLRVEQAQIGNRLVNNQVKDMEEYKFLTGQIAGLTKASDIAAELARRVEDEEEEA